MTIKDMSCHSVRQPLNHFALPRQNTPYYHQRFCTFEFHREQNVSTPVLFYTGNESPLETYINHTGLMWQLGESLNATIVFAEHRYEGHSLPRPDINHCLAYSSSFQALADYARIIELYYKPRPVIVFGGSYGGMLSAWMRYLYPHLVAGAIAASAPVWGLPQASGRIDGASRVIQYGLQQSYPPGLNEQHVVDNYCSDNLRASWPLIKILGDSEAGRSLLTSSFSLCSPLKAGEAIDLVAWAQSPWFNLAEGSFPYPSSYIPFALTGNPDVQLPAWPLQHACAKASRLHHNLGVRFQGSQSEVKYTIVYGDGEGDLIIQVDWDNATAIDINEERLLDSEVIRILLVNVREAVGVWFNMTQDVTCYNLSTAPSMAHRRFGSQDYLKKNEEYPVRWHGGAEAANRTTLCERRIRAGGSWPALYCNDDMNLIITEARGMGNDMFWPPSHPKGTTTYQDVVEYKLKNNLTNDEACDDPLDVFGFFNKKVDPWSIWLDTMFGGNRIDSRSNILFSNGLLDPWSAAGVYEIDPFPLSFRDSSHSRVPGLFEQNISGRDVVALIMQLGGHHTDLMYDDDEDPESIKVAREVEKSYAINWIKQWNKKATQLRDGKAVAFE